MLDMSVVWHNVTVTSIYPEAAPPSLMNGSYADVMERADAIIANVPVGHVSAALAAESC